MHLLPVGTILFVYVDVLIIHGDGGNIHLDVTAGAVVQCLSVRNLHAEFLDECGHVMVRNHLAFPLLHAEGRIGDYDIKVFLDLHLTAESPVVLDLLAGEMDGLRGEDAAASRENLTSALSAAALSAAGGGEENLFTGQSGEE